MTKEKEADSPTMATIKKAALIAALFSSGGLVGLFAPIQTIGDTHWQTLAAAQQTTEGQRTRDDKQDEEIRKLREELQRLVSDLGRSNTSEHAEIKTNQAIVAKDLEWVRASLRVLLERQRLQAPPEP